MTLPAAFLGAPLAHRGLHGHGAPENSLAAIDRAIAAGYGIELDLQLSADGQAMMFHDDGLDRLTSAEGPVNARSATELSAILLTGGDEGIPTFADALDRVAGRAPLLIELKDQSRGLGLAPDTLEQATAAALADYRGPAAVMSFNPRMVANLARLAPDTPRGLTTCAFDRLEWPNLADADRVPLAQISMFDDVSASFISHDRKDLTSRAVVGLKSRGVPILCWTIRSSQEEAEARRIADNITFEHYLAPL